MNSVQAKVLFDDQGPVERLSGVPVYQWWDSSKRMRGTVVIVHGFTQEGRNAEAIARTLSEAGFVVLALDQRGHGRWQQAQWQPGAADSMPGTEPACANCEGGENRKLPLRVDCQGTVQDLLLVCRKAKELHPALPIYCLGESAGAAIVAQAVAADSDSETINGAILCSPGTRPKLFNLFWVMRDLMTNFFRLDHPINLSRYIERYASDDPRVCEEMLTDPLSRWRMSGREIIRTLAFIAHNRKAVSKISPEFPLLLVQGANDHILDPRSTKGLLHSAASTHKSLVVLPSCGHVLLCTSYIKPVVSEKIVDWLVAHSDQALLSVSGALAQGAVSNDHN